MVAFFLVLFYDIQVKGGDNLSDQKIISPLLDGFTLGSPISEHHGVKCCPAIKENTNKKYIVKVISVPATQAQFDALLLAGAYKDPGDAMEYFREKGENILKEAECLQNLSKLEGFLSYDGWQMEPITRRRLGYEVYLVGSYKRSLEKYMRKNAFTHLEAVNLGLDLCAALSVCRQAGFLYVDLKPSNVYVSEKKEFRIGDLGFLSLDSLRYAALPERYFSPYTPPELLDPMVSMNLTVDTYAVGMILYQLYNDGHLPFTGLTPTEELPSPCHADYELAEIIMKAIHPDPEQRWSDPKDLGKAIASYMQKNSVNNIPITPFIPLDVEPESITEASAEVSAEEIAEDNSEEPAMEEALEPESVMNTEPSEEPDAEQIPEEPAEEEQPEEEEASNPEPEEASSIPETEEVNVPVETPEEAISEEESKLAEDTAEGIAEDSAEAPEIQEEAEPDPQVSEEVAKMLSKADDIIAHEIPQETAFPVDVQLPDPFAFAREDEDEIPDDLPEDPLMEPESPEEKPEKKKKKKAKHFENQTRKKKIKKFFSGCFTVILLGCSAVGGFWYYQNVSLQTIDSMSISGTQDQITVLVDTGVEESSLTVHCIDEKGKRQSETLQGGKVVFSDLKASTQYTIQVDMAGFHKLVGKTSDVFTTEATTRISSLQAIAGPEDGSVILSFTVEGGEPDFWNIYYTADGEEEKRETITSHSTTITGLTIGKVYTITVDGGKNFGLSGETSIQYLASRLILAEDLTVTSSDGTDITVLWKTPGDVVVESWNVRCYDGFGSEEQMTVTENTAQFTGLDPASHYTVEVTAAGMTQPARIAISEDPILISDFQVDESAKTEMKITWDYSGTEPEGGWLLMYTVDGSDNQVVQCEKASAKVAPLVPGANYKFILQSADNRTVFNNLVYHQAKEAEVFKELNYVADQVTIDLLRTPEVSDWSFETVGEEDFTTTFAVGESASMVLRSTSSVYVPSNKVKVLFVFRDSYGNVLPELVTEVTHTWKDIWISGDVKTGEIDIPTLPTLPGDYKLELYFNGGAVDTLDFTITA